MHFSKFPRLFFAHLPTPLEPMKNLSRALGEANLWIKRDDCTGLAGGGNKTRKLEFLMADAVEKKANVIITQGAVQSNHVRQTAAISAKLGMKCHALLEERIQSNESSYKLNGNVLFDRIFSAVISYFPKGTDMPNEMELLADKLRQDGKTPYIIPGGGSNGIGALGYANAAMELVDQANKMNLKIDYIVHATGSSGTQSGLLAGLNAIHANIPVLGISVGHLREKMTQNINKCMRETAELLGNAAAIDVNNTVVEDNYVGEGYGIPDKRTLDAVLRVAQNEGILLDPVYTGKGMAGLIGLADKGRFKKGENVVFIHTGGSQGLPGYPQYF